MRAVNRLHGTHVGELLFRNVTLSGVINKNEIIGLDRKTNDRVSRALGTVHQAVHLTGKQGLQFFSWTYHQSRYYPCWTCGTHVKG